MRIFPLKKIKRTGSLNLSINAIVVLILAITMLGLGLGFIRGMFGKTTEELGKISEDIRNQVIEEIERGTSRLIFLKYDVQIEKGDKDEMYYGIKNNIEASPAEDRTFIVSYDCTDAIDSQANPSDIKMDTFETVTAGGGVVKVQKLVIEPRPDSKSTTYKCFLSITTCTDRSEIPNNAPPYCANPDDVETTTKDLMITVP